jgi:hypothetical protein
VPISFSTAVPTDGHSRGLYRAAIAAVAELGAGLALEDGVADAGRLGALVSALLEHDRYRAGGVIARA